MVHLVGNNNNMKNTKTIMTSVILSALLIISGTGYALAQNDTTFGQQVSASLSATEKDTISKSIKSYEVKNEKAKDTKDKIALDKYSLDFKGKQYHLKLFKDEQLNNAEYYIEIGGIDVLQKSNDVAYVGYVVGEPGSRVSLVVSATHPKTLQYIKNDAMLINPR